MKPFYLLLFCCLSLQSARAQNVDAVESIKSQQGPRAQGAEADESQIVILLMRQVQAWNKGNIEQYMTGYWNSDSLLFIGSKGPRYGYKATLDRYKEAYPDAEHMGHLNMDIDNLKRLSDAYYFVVGRWALDRKAGNLSGSFTLLLHNINGHWLIVCDHSS
jgi:hypothetical protein